MEDKIIKYLDEFEKNYNVKILLACETGSRAWGFPSPDSDYDIRVIYMHEKNWYLSLKEEKDTIEYFLDNNEIDISGWDLKKSLILLSKSNPPLLERIQSPIIYKANKEFVREINLVAPSHYSKIATMHHYLSMAKKTFHELTESNEFKLKKFFYSLRAALACTWIMEKESIPPIQFIKMVDELSLPSSMILRIYELINIKSQKNENYLHKGEEEIIQFIKTRIEQSEALFLSLPSSRGQISNLNEFFIKTLSNT